MSFAELGLPKNKRGLVIRLGDNNNNAEKESCLPEIFTYYKVQPTDMLLAATRAFRCLRS
jgi:hypothetical protein